MNINSISGFNFEASSLDQNVEQINLEEETIFKEKLIYHFELSHPDEDYQESASAAKYVLWLVDQFLEKGGNPNLIFPKIYLYFNHFDNPTCFQIVYIFWKSRNWDSEIDKLFENTIDHMLNDPRIDLYAKFTERSLCGCEHFFIQPSKLERLENRKKGIIYYILQELKNEKEGFLLERMNIAHYATLFGDLVTLEKCLKKTHDLIQETCCLTKGKNLLAKVGAVIVSTRNKAGEILSDISLATSSINFSTSNLGIYGLQHLNENDAGLAFVTLDGVQPGIYQVTRTAKVTLMHLAARSANELMTGYLRAKGASTIAVDSDQLSPSQYLQISISDGFVKEVTVTKQLRKTLDPIVRLNKPYLPQTQSVLKRNGYILILDHASKVAKYAFQKFNKVDVRKIISHNKCNFKEDREISELNRSKNSDFLHSGYDRGHLKPAADADSENALLDTYLLTNACPQKPEFNRNYWKEFEKYIRTHAKKYDLVEVFTGGVYIPKLYNDGKKRISYEVIGTGNVAVPTHFFKVLYIHQRNKTYSVAFLLPHSYIDPQTPFKKFETTIESIQKISGILFNEWRKETQNV